MKTLIAITDTEVERIFITDKSQFEKIPVSSTYAQFGQSVNREDAGDYIELLTNDLAKSLNKFLIEQDENNTTYEKGDIISFYDDYEAAQFCIDEGVEGKDYELFEETCLAYNFWNGNNWESIVLEYDNADSEWKILDNSDKIVEEYENREYDGESSGVKYYKSDNYTFAVSLFASSWEHAYIVKEEVDEYQFKAF